MTGEDGTHSGGDMSFRPRSVEGFKIIVVFVHGGKRGYEFSSTVSRYQVVQVCGCHVILGELCGPQ